MSSSASLLLTSLLHTKRDRLSNTLIPSLGFLPHRLSSEGLVKPKITVSASGPGRRAAGHFVEKGEFAEESVFPHHGERQLAMVELPRYFDFTGDYDVHARPRFALGENGLALFCTAANAAFSARVSNCKRKPFENRDAREQVEQVFILLGKTERRPHWIFH